jgi:D-glycero-D-manno-heptose 1,7-bisphosphate phosphatase
VFLDRDGVIVRGLVRGGKSYAPRSLAEFRLLPGAAAAVRTLHKRGFLVVVVTNQPDIGNGLVERSVVEAMHERMHRTMPIDAIEICPHRQTENCRCRKPKPGMLRAAARRFRIDLGRSVMVGDRPSDVVAGVKAGCYTIFIDRGLERCVEVKPNKIVRSLPAATRHILDSLR